MTSCPPSVSTRHRCEARKFFAVLVSVAVFVVGVAVSIGSAASVSAADSCTPLDPFTNPWAASYTASLGGMHVAAAVVDLSSGCQFHFGATDEFPTASTVKAQIMGAVFLALQDHGATVVPEPLSLEIDAMITESDNAAAQALYDWLGGGAMLQAYGRRLGMVSIDDADFGWGGDATTPEDEVRLLKTLLEGGGALSPLWVARARVEMTSIEADQAWGVSGGVPSGSLVALKNGWLFNDGTMWGTPGLWRVNSIGAVELPDGRTYLIAVYGDEWPTEATGITDIETMSARVAGVLSAPRTGPTAILLSATTPAVTAGTTFTAVNPVRLVDTRTTGQSVDPGHDLLVPVAAAVTTAAAAGAVGASPVGSLAAVAVELTALDPAGPGFVTAFADGSPQPLASNLNPLPGRVTANFAIVPVGADGNIRIAASTAVNVIVDLAGGWIAQPGPATAGRLRSITPVRVLDTRTTGTALSAGDIRTVNVAGQGPVPASGVAAVAVTITATDIATDGYWTLWPGSGPRPLASTLNTSAGDTIGNTTIVPVAADGTISVFSQSGGSLVVDVVGWVTDATAPAATAGELTVLHTPVRLYDTRFGDGGQDRLARAVSATLAVVGRDAIPTDAAGFIGNLTTVDPASSGYVTVYPAGGPQPATSTTNPDPTRDPSATAVISGLGAGGDLAVYASTSVDVVLDAWGWFTT